MDSIPALITGKDEIEVRTIVLNSIFGTCQSVGGSSRNDAVYHLSAGWKVVVKRGFITGKDNDLIYVVPKSIKVKFDTDYALNGQQCGLEVFNQLGNAKVIRCMPFSLTQRLCSPS